MHTIKQAESLWCPMVRFEGDVGGSLNRGSLNSNPTNADISFEGDVDGVTKPIQKQKYGCHCVSDKCAMWRWETKPRLESESFVTCERVAWAVGEIPPRSVVNPFILTKEDEDAFSEQVAFLERHKGHKSVPGLLAREGWRTIGSAEIVRSMPMSKLVIKIVREHDTDASGYCGLAGRPGAVL